MGAMPGLLLLLWAGVTVGSLEDLQKRIIGGGDCPDEERRYHVQLRDASPDRFVCGGSLIGAQWVLTAAHCYSSTVYAVVGVHPGKDKEKLDVVLSYQFNDHDLMLMKIKKSKHIHPFIKLPDCASLPKKGDEVQIAGHASTTMGPNNVRVRGESLILQCANTEVVDCFGFKQCLKKNYSKFSASKKHEKWLCYQRENVDTSAGDSGGGVVFNNMIYGVHVQTGNHTHACVEPAASMALCHVDYLDWIYRTTGIARP